MNKQVHNIAFACDNNFAQHLAVLLSSILRSIDLSSQYNFFILDGGINTESLKKLKSLISNPLHTFNVIKTDTEILSKAPISGHISIATYFRLLLPHLLPETVRTVLYLDSDMIVMKDLNYIFKLVPEPFVLSAVRDLGNPKPERLGLEECDYFNCGVLLINIFLWKQYKITEQVLSYISNSQQNIKFWDQDALNAVIRGRWRRLPLNWNIQTKMFDRMHLNHSELREAVNNALETPAIIHFSSPSKPWSFLNNHPYKNVYYKNLKMTPWRGFRPPDRNIKNIIRKLVHKFIRPFFLSEE